MISLITFLTKRTLLTAICTFCCLVVLILYPDLYFKQEKQYEFLLSNENQSNLTDVTGYLVYSSKCKIPDLDPFNADAKPFYHPEKYKACSKLKPLSFIDKVKNTNATLRINTKAISSYSKKGVKCCYSNITRKWHATDPDNNIEISTCHEIPLDRPTTISNPFIMVKCKNKKTGQTVYTNTHAIITLPKPQPIPKNDNPKYSILLIGIDSISRLNFVREFPKTYEFVHENHWIPLYGYNKIEDNTFPNLMGILTGLNQSVAYSKCNPKVLNKLDECPMLWYKFRSLGYTTIYAEDDTSISTFNFRKKGFTIQPTDIYLRPYMMASEQLHTVNKDGMTYCTGPETSGERILHVAKDFAQTYNTLPTFGLFWMNTFSHNKINSGSGMDKKVLEFLDSLRSSGVTNETIVIFLSDHGIRFGEIRYTTTGWLEERLPFIFLSIPPKFRSRFPVELSNLQDNSNKLTTPYDLYMTLQHILSLSDTAYVVKKSDACPKCRSLFEVMPNARSCEDAKIEQHWCTCNGYNHIDKHSNLAEQISKFILNHINDIIHKYSYCTRYKVQKILSVSVSEQFSYKNDTYALMMMQTKPKAVFEATVLLNANGSFTFVGSISRLDSYSAHSKCMDDAYLQKYCYCKR